MREYVLKLQYNRWKRFLYRWGLPNGWHCGHWHHSLDAASDCLLEHTYDAS